jgi:hypothetical protein
LITSCWFALGARARAQLDEYLHRSLDFLGADLARHLARTVQTDSADRLRAVLRAAADLGADELHLVPTTADPVAISGINSRRSKKKSRKNIKSSCLTSSNRESRRSARMPNNQPPARATKQPKPPSNRSLSFSFRKSSTTTRFTQSSNRG